jgi:hypothetical protein
MGGPGTAAADPGLIDSATGERFWLGVADGALTLGPGLSATGVNASEAVLQIGLADTVTAKTYELAVVSGGLTLIAN